MLPPVYPVPPKTTIVAIRVSPRVGPGDGCPAVPGATSGSGSFSPPATCLSHQPGAPSTPSQFGQPRSDEHPDRCGGEVSAGDGDVGGGDDAGVVGGLDGEYGLPGAGEWEVVVGGPGAVPGFEGDRDRGEVAVGVGDLEVHAPGCQRLAVAVGEEHLELA